MVLMVKAGSSARPSRKYDAMPATTTTSMK
jgi:hypothetical protein